MNGDQRSGIPPVNYPRFALTGQALLERSLRTNGPRPALIDGDRVLSYDDLERRSSRLISVLRAAGASDERPAAMYAPTVSEWVDYDLACARGGLTRLGLNGRLHENEVLDALGRMGAATLITDLESYARLAQTGDLSVDLVLIIGVSDEEISADGPGSRVMSYDGALGSARPAVIEPVSPDSPFHIGLTSGTTGRPKGATHTQGGRAASMVTFQMAGQLDRSTHALHFLSPSNASLPLLGVMVAGGVNELVPTADPERLLARCAESPITNLTLVPLVAERLLEIAPEQPKTDALRRMIIFGAPLPRPVLEGAIDRFGPVVTFAYGATEAPMPVCALQPTDYAGHEFGSPIFETVGRPMPLWEVKHEAREEGNELLIRGRALMGGYWGNEEATQEVLDTDGWYSTGDLGQVLEDGTVKIAGRSREFLISGGYNVYPAEVEGRLREHESINDAVVLGVDDADWGELVAAYVVLEPGESLAPDAVSEWVRGGLAGYKRPRRVVVVDELPRGPFGKVRKGELRERLIAEPELGSF